MIKPAAALLAAAVLLTACTETVSGTSTRGGVSSSGTDASSSPAPTPSSIPPPESSTPPPEASLPPQQLACPVITDSRARLSYRCISPLIVHGQRSAAWPVNFQVEVDLKWTLDEGSSPNSLQSGHDPATVARTLTTAMAAGNYGPSPGIKRERDTDLVVDGKKAHLVRTLFTIAPSYRAKLHVRVRQEQLWVVAVQVTPDQVSAWYVSVPDVTRDLWVKVPAVMGSLKVV